MTLPNSAALEQQIHQRYLDRLDDEDWDEEDPRLDFGAAALPYFVAAFERETKRRRRTRLLRVIWQFRELAALPILASALQDRDSAVWKEAADGLVTLGGQGALTALKDARGLIAQNPNAAERRAWIDEAIDQVRDSMSS